MSTKKQPENHRPHGSTSNSVWSEVRRLYYAGSTPKPVSRTALLAALNLPAYVLDDRLRVLKAKQSGDRLRSAGRGLYVPVHSGPAERDADAVRVSWVTGGKVELLLQDRRLELTPDQARLLWRHLDQFLRNQRC